MSEWSSNVRLPTYKTGSQEYIDVNHYKYNNLVVMLLGVDIRIKIKYPYKLKTCQSRCD